MVGLKLDYIERELEKLTDRMYEATRGTTKRPKYCSQSGDDTLITGKRCAIRMAKTGSLWGKPVRITVEEIK